MNEMITAILSSKLFGIDLSLLAFYIGVLLNQKLKSPLLNPLLIAIILVILTLTVFQIPLEYYENGGEVINMFLPPATTVLAYSIYHQRKLLKRYFLPIIVGCVVGAGTSLACILLMCRAFGLTETLTSSMLPKSVTTPIAIEISGQLGGIESVTVAAVSSPGFWARFFLPFLLSCSG